MKKTTVLLLLMAAIIAGCARGPGFVKKPPPGIKRIEKAEPSALPEEVFPVGEKLTYRLKWSGINVGTAAFQVEGVEGLGKNRAYRLVVRGKPSRWFGLVYKIDKTLVSYFDAKRLFSLRFERERHNNKKEVYVFDQDNHVYTYTRGGEEWSGPIAPRTQDILSALYFSRLLDYSEGRLVEVNTALKKKNYKVTIETIGKERVVVPAGTFPALKVALKVEALLSSGGHRKEKGAGRLRLWFSRDERKFPVLAKSRFLLGTVTFKLINIENGSRKP